MKVKLLVILLTCIHHFNYSQANKSLKGIVISDNFLLQNVDVINKTTQTSTTTNANGEFVLSAKVNDSIIFYSKEYYLKCIKLSPNDIETNNISVSMVKKPEELEEIIIRQTPKIDLKSLKKWEQIKRDEITAERTENRLKTPGIYDGIIDKGLNLKRIAKTLFGHSKKELTDDKLSKNEFKELAKNICDQKFYLQTLKLKPEETALFLDFCDADPQSKILMEHPNVLSMMDFLSTKNLEFQKQKN
jgi:hypothetical protein